MSKITIQDISEKEIQINFEECSAFSYTNKVEILEKIKKIQVLHMNLEKLIYPGSLLVETIFDIVILCKSDLTKSVIFYFKNNTYSEIIYNALKSLNDSEDRIKIVFKG